jgi:TonB family protein
MLKGRISAIAFASLVSVSASAADMGGAVYAAGDETPGDIYRTWQLYQAMSDDQSVAGELRLADLGRWQHEHYRSAYYWYTRAAYEGDGIAAANLWYMYTLRSDRAADNQKALGFYEIAKASDAGLRQLLALETKVAVDDARHYPDGLDDGRHGTALVEFERDAAGKAADVKVYRSSGSAELDSAAVAAVQAADLPVLPARLAGLHHFVISVSLGPEHG